MALKYYVSARQPTCSNKECDNYGNIIPIDIDYVSRAKIGDSWRTFCPGCVDRAVWTLDSIEWDKTSHIDEIILNLRIQLGPQKDPVDNGVSKPYWIHDCEKCVWLGSHEFVNEYYDFYWCMNGKSEVSKGSGVIRNGNLTENNESYPYRVLSEWDSDELDRSVFNVLQRLVMTHLNHR